MAAIIAQITRKQRERKVRERTWKMIDSSKCLYSLPPFDAQFDPTVHNQFVRNRTMNKEDEMMLRNINMLIAEKEKKQMVVKITWKEKMLEVMMIGIIC